MAANDVPAGPALSGCQVLVVDDRDDTRAAIRAILAGNGAAVSECVSAEEALVAVSNATRPPDVVVTDFSLLGARHDGAWLLRQIRATRGEGIGVIVATGYVERGDELSKIGFDGIVFKPLETAELVALVAAVWETRRAKGR